MIFHIPLTNLDLSPRSLNPYFLLSIEYLFWMLYRQSNSSCVFDAPCLCPLSQPLGSWYTFPDMANGSSIVQYPRARTWKLFLAASSHFLSSHPVHTLCTVHHHIVFLQPSYLLKSWVKALGKEKFTFLDVFLSCSLDLCVCVCVSFRLGLISACLMEESPVPEIMDWFWWGHLWISRKVLAGWGVIVPAPGKSQWHSLPAVMSAKINFGEDCKGPPWPRLQMTTAAVRPVGVLSYDPNLKALKILLFSLSCTEEVMVLSIPLVAGCLQKAFWWFWHWCLMYRHSWNSQETRVWSTATQNDCCFALWGTS